MTITINGQVSEIAADLSVLNLLQTLNLANKPVVVELNRLALFPRDFADTIIPDHAEIEIVTLAAGG